MKFFLKCEEAAYVCDKSQYNEAGFFEKFMLKIHLVMCKLCRHYSKCNVKLTNTINSSNLKTLNSAEKKLLKNRIQEELYKEE